MFQTIRSFVSLYGQGEDITPTQSQCVPRAHLRVEQSIILLIYHSVYSLFFDIVLFSLFWGPRLFCSFWEGPLELPTYQGSTGESGRVVQGLGGQNPIPFSTKVWE